jgi:unsaturated rhamnogalacturonyl hydrolase
MKRRSFISLVSVSGAGFLLFPDSAYPSVSGELSNLEQRVIFKIIQSHPIDLLPGKRVPFGWPAIGISPGESIRLKPTKKLNDTNLWMRVSIAQEIWDKKILHVSIPGSDVKLGVVDIRFSSVLVPYEVELPGKFARLINKHGLDLTLESKTPIWIFNEPAIGIDNSAFLPHILSSPKQKGTVDDFLGCLMSVNSVQAFGWREGTVLDGLWQIYSQKGEARALEAIKQHLKLFLDKNQNLVYETSQSTPKDNQIDGIESTIPFATLARIYPEHPIIQTVLNAWGKYTKPNGMVIDGQMISAEGCYTVAYPMAVLAKILRRDDLKKNALEQLRHRFVLMDSGQLYLRSKDGIRTYQNWARGAAWFLLGFARTISELKDEIQDQLIIDKFREGISIALSMQREDGLWSCFMHERNSLPDTSGSAGIAAAIVVGIQNGYLPEFYKEPVSRCWKSMQNYLTPDGFLKGVAQDNRGGLELQQGEYRVIAQMGMGFMAQLYAGI